VRGPAVGEQRAVPPDRVLEPEAGSADVEAARSDLEQVAEARGRAVADVRLDRGRVDAGLEQRRVAALEAREVVDPGDLEPDEVVGVVRDRLRVGLGEPYG
jgi:hypothetical protein